MLNWIVRKYLLVSHLLTHIELFNNLLYVFKTVREEARRQLHKNVASNIE